MKRERSISSSKVEKAFITRSGINLKRMYGPDDISDIIYSKEIGEPGQFPYTRGKLLKKE